MKILGISGSLRTGSLNGRLLEAARAELPEGVEMDIYEHLEAIPPFNEDREAGEAVLHFRAAIAGADAVLISTPEYNQSIPGQLKNALDWASRPFRTNVFRNKPVAVLGASSGLFGAVFAQAELRKVLGRMGAVVVDEELPVGQAISAFDDRGGLLDPDLSAALAALVGELIDAAAGAEKVLVA